MCRNSVFLTLFNRSPCEKREERPNDTGSTTAIECRDQAKIAEFFDLWSAGQDTVNRRAQQWYGAVLSAVPVLRRMKHEVETELFHAEELSKEL